MNNHKLHNLSGLKQFSLALGAILLVVSVAYFGDTFVKAATNTGQAKATTKCEVPFVNITTSLLRDNKITDITEDNFKTWSQKDSSDNNYGYTVAEWSKPGGYCDTASGKEDPTKCGSGDEGDLKSIIYFGQKNPTGTYSCNNSGYSTAEKIPIETINSYISRGYPIPITPTVIDGEYYTGSGKTHEVVAIGVIYTNGASTDYSVDYSIATGFDLEIWDPNGPTTKYIRCKFNGQNSGNSPYRSYSNCSYPFTNTITKMVDINLFSTQSSAGSLSYLDTLISKREAFCSNQENKNLSICKTTPIYKIHYGEYPTFSNEQINNEAREGQCFSYSLFVTVVSILGNFTGECSANTTPQTSCVTPTGSTVPPLTLTP